MALVAQTIPEQVVAKGRQQTLGIGIETAMAVRIIRVLMIHNNLAPLIL